MNFYRQKGMSFWGILGLGLIAAFFLLIIVKLFPLYYMDFRVRTALESLKDLPGANDMSNQEIRGMLERRFSVDDIDKVMEVKDILTFEKRGKKRVARIYYERIEPFAYNVSLLVEFDHDVEVGTFDQ